MKSLLLGAVCACVVTLLSLSTHTALIPRLGGQVVYDTDLDITWLADANLVTSNRFGVRNSMINHTGIMIRSAATEWLDAMNADGGTGYLGFDG